jgi:hypothetical protein
MLSQQMQRTIFIVEHLMSVIVEHLTEQQERLQLPLVTSSLICGLNIADGTMCFLLPTCLASTESLAKKVSPLGQQPASAQHVPFVSQLLPCLKQLAYV